jgi:CRP-like cAMP-binding protein
VRPVEEAIKSLDFFKDLTPRQLENTAVKSRIKNYEKDDFVVYKCDESTDLYIVLEGCCRGVLLDDDGGEILLANFEKGEVFGEVNLIDKKGRTSTVIANGDLKLLKISYEAIHYLIKENHKISMWIMELLVERLRNANDIIESLAFLNVKERILKQLLDVADKESLDKNNYYTAKKHTHQEISSMIGASRESVTKCFKILTLEGSIKLQDGCILVRKGEELF